MDQGTRVCTPGPDRGLLTPEPTSSLWPPCPPPAAGRETLAEGHHLAPDPQASLAHTSSWLCFQRLHWPASAHPGIPWTGIVPVPSASSLRAAVTEVENCTLRVQSARCQKDLVGQPPNHPLKRVEPPGRWLGSQTSHGNGSCVLARLGFQTTETNFPQPWRREVQDQGEGVFRGLSLGV